jgi:hypothetical protein
MSDATVLDHEPFPRLRWRDGDWEGRTSLLGWAGIRAGRRSDAHPAGDGPPDGEVGLSVYGDSHVPQPPSEAQARAWRHLVQNEAAVTAAVLRAILDAYPALQEMYGYEGEEAAERMPDVASVDELKERVRPSFVHVLTDERDGMAFVGFELECAWDEEHGLGVMTHGGRVLEVGQAETAFGYSPDDDEEEDGEEEDASPGRRAPAAPAMPRPKQWWEFWK